MTDMGLPVSIPDLPLPISLPPPPQAVLLLYYAPWCGFCASLSHIFIQLARILPPKRFMVAR